MVFDAETADNNPDIEKQWAVKALMHAETYFNLISTFPDVKLLKLTPYVHQSVQISDSPS
jgi:hypothetical protein